MKWKGSAEIVFIFRKSSQSGTHFGTDWVYLTFFALLSAS